MATRNAKRNRVEDEQLDRAYRAATATRSKKKKSKKSSARGNIVIICFAILLISTAFLALNLTSCSNNSDLIVDNVYVAGVNVGGMTKHDAIDAVKNATDDTYTRLDMIVQAMGFEAVISPDVSGAKLNVKAAVNKAFDVGRSGNAAQQAKDKLLAATSGYNVDISDCLNLDTDAVRSKLEQLGNQFSSLLKQTSYTVTGEVPKLDMDSGDAGTMVLTVQVGTPQRSMDLEAVYQQVMDAYNSNVFTVEASCNITAPDALDLQTILDTYAVAPVDASLDSKTYEVIPGSYGYGFDLEKAQSAISAAEPGSEISISFEKIAPEVDASNLTEVLFRDVLGKYTATSSNKHSGRDENLRLACEAINGVVLYPGDVFSYNGTLGERTAEKGYKPGPSYIGSETVDTIGGGICQVSSALYYCTLVADLDIIFRDYHGFATEYMPLGMDAVVSWGTLDFKFSNNTNYPIMIDAVANGSSVTVQILGTDDKDYYIKMENEILKEDKHKTTYREMYAGNSGGYKDGDEIVEGYTGYDVDVYKCKYSKADDRLISRDYVDSSYYKRRDAVVCSIISDGSGNSGSTTETTNPGTGGSGGISDSGGALPDE